jgi:hypothetical protein
VRLTLEVIQDVRAHRAAGPFAFSNQHRVSAGSHYIYFLLPISPGPDALRQKGQAARGGLLHHPVPAKLLEDGADEHAQMIFHKLRDRSGMPAFEGRDVRRDETKPEAQERIAQALDPFVAFVRLRFGDRHAPLDQAQILENSEMARDWPAFYAGNLDDFVSIMPMCEPHRISMRRVCCSRWFQTFCSTDGMLGSALTR